MRDQRENEALNTAIREEKMLTREWYLRMSLQVPWKPGQRESFAARFDALDREIDRLWAMDNAEWFSNLP